MGLFVSRRSIASFIFIIGFFLMFLGCAFLIESLMNVSRVSIVVSFLLIILGITCAVFAIKLNWRSVYLFFAALFLQAGLFLSLYTLHIIPVVLSHTWPLVSVFAGVALLPAGWHRYGVARSFYIVPAFGFIILGAILMIFTLGLVSFSLAQFVRNWWPLLVLLAGLTLVLISLGTKISAGSKKIQEEFDE